MTTLNEPKNCPICNDPANPFIGKCPHGIYEPKTGMTYQKAKSVFAENGLWEHPYPTFEQEREIENAAGFLEGRASLEPVARELMGVIDKALGCNNKFCGCKNIAKDTLSRAQKELEER